MMVQSFILSMNYAMRTESLTAGDARTLIKSLEPASIDLAILDPNYNDWDSLCNTGFIDDVLTVLKPSGNIVCFTKQPFDYNLRSYINPYFRREIIWSFTNGGAWVSHKMPLVSFQKLFWLAKTDDFFFNSRTGLDYQETTKSIKRSTKVFGGYKEDGKDFIKSDDGTWVRDHYHFNKPTDARIFAKPFELIQILVRCFSPVSGIVLDPFAGSCITNDVCWSNNRSFIGFEIDETAVDDFHIKRQSMLF